MEAISAFFNTMLSFLLRLLELFIGFWIAVLQLILDFARSLVGLVS
jgi:hypothetical protein